LALWLLGYPEQATRRIDQALISARELTSPYNVTFALVFAAWLHQFRRAAPRVQELAESVVELATEQGFPFWVALGTALRGWAWAEQGREQEGILQLLQGWTAWQQTGAATLTPYFRALLAELQDKMGQADECCAGLAEALKAADASGERFYEAELYRLKGALRFSQFEARYPEKNAEEFFRQAVTVARRQQAKSLELRATTSLARLLSNQGRRDEARAMLAEVYNWFTEGFDTADLKEAKALIEELSR
jgi:predicted ATPase